MDAIQWKHWPFNLWPRKHDIGSNNPAPILVVLSYCQCRMHKEKLIYWKWFHTHLKKHVTLSHNILDYTCLCFKIQQLVWFSLLLSKQTSKKPIIFFFWITLGCTDLTIKKTWGIFWMVIRQIQFLLNSLQVLLKDIASTICISDETEIVVQSYSISLLSACGRIYRT